MNASNLMPVINSFEKKITPDCSLLRAYFFTYLSTDINIHTFVELEYYLLTYLLTWTKTMMAQSY